MGWRWERARRLYRSMPGEGRVQGRRVAERGGQMTASGGRRPLPTPQPNLALHRPASHHVPSRSPATIQFPLLSCSSLAALDLLFLSRPFLSPPWPLGTVVYRPPWTHRSHLSSPRFLVVCNSLHIFQQCLQSTVVSSTRIHSNHSGCLLRYVRKFPSHPMASAFSCH